MNYHEIVDRFWAKDAEYQFSDKETALYFYLLNACKLAHWRNPFGLSNNMTLAKFGWGRTSFDRARSRLKEAGLIDFRAGIGRGNIYSYVIKDENGDNRNPVEKLSENFIQPDIFSGQNSGTDIEKDVQMNTFSEKVLEKGAQKDTFYGQFSGKVFEKGVQTDTFSEQFYSSKALNTKCFQPVKNEKSEKKSYIHTYNSIYNKEYKDNKVCEVENEKTSPPKEKNAAHKENEVLELYRTVCCSFPQIMQITCRRKEKIMRRLAEMGGITILAQVFQKMEASDFLKGNNRTGWKATFDWVFKNSDNWMKILEGNYDNHPACLYNAKPANDARFMGMLQTDLSKF